jgi:hypothetical protein
MRPEGVKSQSNGNGQTGRTAPAHRNGYATQNQPSMAKPSLVPLPLMLLLLDFWPLKRFTISDLRFTSTFRKVLLEKVPLIVFAVHTVPVDVVCWTAQFVIVTTERSVSPPFPTLM